MSRERNITPVPLREPPLRPAYLPDALFASDEGAGLGTPIHKPERILIVEDDLLIATQIEAALSDAGFDIIGPVTTGEEAIEVAGTKLPDLAVVDIRLAGNQDGVETALELFRLRGIRCIFASAYSNDHASRQRAAPAAPLGWLQKPYSMASLVNLVRSALNEMHGKGHR